MFLENFVLASKRFQYNSDMNPPVELEYAVWHVQRNREESDDTLAKAISRKISVRQPISFQSF